MQEKIICGFDEVGRGALAGPIVGACAVINPKTYNKMKNTGIKINDSKKLSKSDRVKAYKFFLNEKVPFAVKTVSVKIINSSGINFANISLFQKLYRLIYADEYIIDGLLKPEKLSEDKKVRTLAKADVIIPSVMAASIIAKVYRDKLMVKYTKKYPFFGWQTNYGYGTKYHIESIIKHGITKLHRTKFVSTALENYNLKINHKAI